MAELAFDPTSRGARRLALTWLPQLERWVVKINDGHFYRSDSDAVVEAGETVEVSGPHGQQLVADGAAELVSVRRVSAR